MIISNTELEVLRECRYNKYNIGSKVSEQICENDIQNRKIHTFKCLVTGDISLSWNLGGKIEV